jgi:hypothetical protein
MGYLSINNLYKPAAQCILQFKTLYALEKIHGTSAHIRYKDGELTFFSGGEKHEKFVNLFDQDALLAAFNERFGAGVVDVTIYGEAYGGKQQGMSATYGPDLKFVAFDVELNGRWLDVPQAASLTRSVGLEFVDYAEIPSTMADIDGERDRPSSQAIRNGITEPRIREDIVLRPPFEVTMGYGERCIAKHKRDEFRETKTARTVNKESHLKSLDIAEEYVTAMRFEHVVDQLLRTRDDKQLDMPDIPDLIKLMCADVLKEGDNLVITDEKSFNKAVGAKVVKMLKARLMSRLEATV